MTKACHGCLVIDRYIRSNLLSNGDYHFTFIAIVDIIFRDAFVRVSVGVVVHVLNSRYLFKHRLPMHTTFELAGVALINNTDDTRYCLKFKINRFANA